MAHKLESKRDQSPRGDRPNMSDLRIVLLGKNVKENNRVGNLILNKKVFENKTFPDDVDEQSGKEEGRNITVINTIHLLNQQLKLQKVSELSTSKPHVIILVLQHNDFNQKKRNILTSVLNSFGDQAMKRTMILTTDEKNNAKHNEFIQELSKECGGCLQLRQNTTHFQILQKVDEIITHSWFKEIQKIPSMNQEDMPKVFTKSANQKLILAMCGCNEEMHASMLKLLLEKNIPPIQIPAQVPKSVRVWRDMELHDHMISLVELPALNQLSEEEMKCETLHCVSLCDPGVNVFIIIVPVSPLNPKEKSGIEKIQKIFQSFEHFILLFITNRPVDEHTDHFINSTPESQRLISRCGGQYRVMGLKESENSRQIPDLLDCIENMKTEPYSLQMYVKAQENRARQDELKKMETEKQKLQTEMGRSFPEDHRPIDCDLRIVLLGKNVSENNRVGNFILGEDAFDTSSAERKFCELRQEVGEGLKDRLVSIISSPQLLQPNLSPSQITQTVRECVNMSNPGPHVFILVLQHRDFNDEDGYRVKQVLNKFSEEAVKRTIVITTDEERYMAMFTSYFGNKSMNQLIQECGGGHLKFDEKNPEWQSEISNMVDRILPEYLTCHISLDQEQSKSEDENQESFDHSDDGKREERQKGSNEVSAHFSGKQKLNLVLCGSDTLTVSVSKLLRGEKNTPSHQGAIRSECVRTKVELHDRLISLVELPALNRLSEEEVMRQTLCCMSLCDPGVHAFIIIVPVGPLTDEDEAEVEKIKIIFDFRNHFIPLFTTDLTDKELATEFVESSTDAQRLISLCEGRYRLMGLKESVNSRQIPDLLNYIENIKTEPYSPQMYVKAQENRARQELEEQHKKELSEKDTKIKELEQKIQSDGAEVEADDPKSLRIVLIGRTGNGKSATGNTILGRKEFHSQLNTDSVTTVCKKGVGEIDGRSVAVVDTPGLFDTTLSNEKVIDELVKCVSLSSPGPHVFVIVLSLGRFTKEETDTVDLIKKVFGPKAAQFSIVLFTRGDDLEEDESIQDYVKRSTNAELKKLISDCGNRFLVFNNKEKQDKTRQAIELLNMIEDVKKMNEGRYFTNSMFEEAEMSIKKRMEEILKEKEREIQAQNEKLRVKYEKEMEELKTNLEEEKRKADEERKQKENEFRQKEERLMKEFEEKYKIEQQRRETENQKRSEEKKQLRAEYDDKIEEMKRETEIQRSQYEKQQKEREEEDKKREEKYKQDQEKMKHEQEFIIAELKMKQEEEIKKRDLEKKRKNEEEEKERQEWERKIKEAENNKKGIQEDIQRQQKEWVEDKKRQMREREEVERKRKETHEEQLREKQEEQEKMRKRFEREREEEQQKIEKERQKQKREREEKEREFEEKKTEMKIYYERLERERKEEWERIKQEEDERREEEKKTWKKKIEDLKQEQEEEIKKREKEEKERKEREKKERIEMEQKHEEEIKEMKKKHSDEARKQAEEFNDFKEKKDQHTQELKQMLDERQKHYELLEKLYRHLKDQKEEEIKEMQDQKEEEIKEMQDQKEKEIKELQDQKDKERTDLRDKKDKEIKELEDKKKNETQELIQQIEELKKKKTYCVIL